LVIHTDEMYLSKTNVEAFLTGARFQVADLITDAFLGLSYHAADSSEGGECPVFRLVVEPR
jgi:hypothetical protein